MNKILEQVNEDRMIKIQNTYFGNERFLSLDLVDTCRRIVNIWDKNRLKDESDVQTYKEDVARLHLLSYITLLGNTETSELLSDCINEWEREIELLKSIDREM